MLFMTDGLPYIMKQYKSKLGSYRITKNSQQLIRIQCATVKYPCFSNDKKQTKYSFHSKFIAHNWQRCSVSPTKKSVLNLRTNQLQLFYCFRTSSQHIIEKYTSSMRQNNKTHIQHALYCKVISF